MTTGRLGAVQRSPQCRWLFRDLKTGGADTSQSGNRPADRRDHIRSDNGSEFTAKRVRERLERVVVKTLSIEPGSPWENGYIESFIGKLPDELVAREVFDTLLGEGAD